METVKRNIKGGKDYKKYKTKRERTQPKQDNISINVDEGEGYFATVLEIQGGNKVKVKLNNGTEETVTIPGRMKKGRRGNWIKVNMVVLVSTDHEIMKILRETDKDITIARNMLDKVSGSKSYFNFNNDSSSDDDSDNDDSSDNKKENAVNINRNDMNNNFTFMMQNRNRMQEKEKEDSEEHEEETEEEEEEEEESDNNKLSFNNKKQKYRQRQYDDNNEIDINTI